MQNEIQILDQVVDMSIGNGMFKTKEDAQAVIHAIGVIKAQVPKLVQDKTLLEQEIHAIRAKSEELVKHYEEMEAELQVLKEKHEGAKPGPEKNEDKVGPSRNKEDKPPRHKQNS